MPAGHLDLGQSCWFGQCNPKLEPVSNYIVPAFFGATIVINRLGIDQQLLTSFLNESIIPNVYRNHRSDLLGYRSQTSFTHVIQKIHENPGSFEQLQGMACKESELLGQIPISLVMFDVSKHPPMAKSQLCFRHPLWLIVRQRWLIAMVEQLCKHAMIGGPPLE